MFVFPQLVSNASSQNDESGTSLSPIYFWFFSYGSYPFKLSYCIIKYHIQHPERNPPSRTSSVTPSSPPVTQPAFSSPQSKCNQHSLRNGHRIARNNIQTYGNYDTDSHEPNHSVSCESTESTNCRVTLSCDITHTSQFHSNRWVSEDGYTGDWRSFGRSETDYQEGSRGL